MSTLSFCQIRLVVFDCAGQRQSLLNGTDPSLYTCCSVCEISKQGENQSLPLGLSSMKRLVMYLRRCKCVNLRGNVSTAGTRNSAKYFICSDTGERDNTFKMFVFYCRNQK